MTNHQEFGKVFPLQNFEQLLKVKLMTQILDVARLASSDIYSFSLHKLFAFHASLSFGKILLSLRVFVFCAFTGCQFGVFRVHRLNH